ncbi:MAG: glycerophosphodiester phosphodiesterase family protein [Geminicoccaceae bacterium]
MIKRAFLSLLFVAFGADLAIAEEPVSLGPRPFYLVNQLQDGELKETLQACAGGPFEASAFSIGHRGAPLQFPEHTRESYVAAARMGAGILECDVTFTKDRELVCRHAQCDLHTTTDILATPLAETCRQPFTPADPASGTEASAMCCTADLTLDQFRSLNGKMDAADVNAATVEEYMQGTAPFRTDLYATTGTLMTHAESIQLFHELGVGFTPELKSPEVEMPFEGDYTQADYAQAMVEEYKEAGIDPARVFAQSFNEEDVRYWIENEPDFGAQAVYLDDRYDIEGFDFRDPSTYEPSMEDLAKDGVRIVAPPLWMLVDLENGQIVPSAYAEAAKEAGLQIITWTLERSGPLASGGGWYFQSIESATTNDGVTYELLDVLAKDVGVIGVFSDWPATTTYYANCVGLE